MGHILEHLESKPYSNLEGITDHSLALKKAMTAFLKRDIDYRMQYSQSNFDVGFDGYSFPGQVDSINQAYDDHLHSMVLSEFYPVESYPQEFHTYLKEVFPVLIEEVSSSIDMEGLTLALGLEGKLGFSFSVNYYPSFESSGRPSGERLTKHIDGSLLTIFPYGFGEGLQFNTGNKWENWEHSKQPVCFPGYMMELVTDKRVDALNHRLTWVENSNAGRFAFALFLVPKTSVQLEFPGGARMNTVEYYKNYLALFD